jgi:hypothetical protein
LFERIGVDWFVLFDLMVAERIELFFVVIVVVIVLVVEYFD